MVVQITLEEQKGQAEQHELPLDTPGRMSLRDYLAMRLRDELDLIEPALLARLLNITEQTLAVWRSEKTGPDYVKLGKSVFYRGADLEAWVDRNTHQASLGESKGEVVPLPTAFGKTHPGDTTGL